MRPTHNQSTSCNLSWLHPPTHPRTYAAFNPHCISNPPIINPRPLLPCAQAPLRCPS
jgi:hypothetical protein